MLSRRDFLSSTAAFAGAAAMVRPRLRKAPSFRAVRSASSFRSRPAAASMCLRAWLPSKMTKQTGAVFVIDNRPGGNATIGGNAVKTAPADGYTLLFSAATHVMARHVIKNAPYDPLADFAPIARVGEAPMLLVMAPNRKPETVAELIAAIKKDQRNGRSVRPISARRSSRDTRVQPGGRHGYRDRGLSRHGARAISQRAIGSSRYRL